MPERESKRARTVKLEDGVVKEEGRMKQEEASVFVNPGIVIKQELVVKREEEEDGDGHETEGDDYIPVGASSLHAPGSPESLGGERMGFGKHMARTRRWVLENDGQYCLWALGEPDPGGLHFRLFVDYIRMRSSRECLKKGRKGRQMRFNDHHHLYQNQALAAAGATDLIGIMKYQTLGFGAYADETYDQVYRKRRGYCVWALGEEADG